MTEPSWGRPSLESRSILPRTSDDGLGRHPLSGEESSEDSTPGVQSVGQFDDASESEGSQFEDAPVGVPSASTSVPPVASLVLSKPARAPNSLFTSGRSKQQLGEDDDPKSMRSSKQKGSKRSRTIPSTSFGSSNKRRHGSAREEVEVTPVTSTSMFNAHPVPPVRKQAVRLPPPILPVPQLPGNPHRFAETLRTPSERLLEAAPNGPVPIPTYRIHHHDIICWKQDNCYHQHIGNIFLEKLVRNKQMAYVAAKDDGQRREIATVVYDVIDGLRPRGRFLCQGGKWGDTWCEAMSKEPSLDMIELGFREGPTGVLGGKPIMTVSTRRSPQHWKQTNKPAKPSKASYPDGSDRDPGKKREGEAMLTHPGFDPRREGLEAARGGLHSLAAAAYPPPGMLHHPDMRAYYGDPRAYSGLPPSYHAAHGLPDPALVDILEARHRASLLAPSSHSASLATSLGSPPSLSSRLPPADVATSLSLEHSALVAAAAYESARNREIEYAGLLATRMQSEYPGVPPPPTVDSRMLFPTSTNRELDGIRPLFHNIVHRPP